jgi:hypothetical protein
MKHQSKAIAFALALVIKVVILSEANGPLDLNKAKRRP